ncbi:uncharacterized protein LOC142556946 [Primulina tabacum]|uniref:uncharacterized protein LOC142556946 n=1 Tax=Primulina tabacum TaxID=48773 RepID=UPI003F5925BE
MGPYQPDMLEYPALVNEGFDNWKRNAPKNAQYIAPEIQKEILHIMANRVRQMVREKVGEKYLCILIDEARDISKREQMAIILRFVNNRGILTERFFAIKSVSDTTSMNLKNEISNVLVHHDLHVKKIRGQGYDAKDVSVIWELFSHLDNIVNIVTSSTKSIDELQSAQRNEIEYMLAIGERDFGSSANQIVLSDHSPNGNAKAEVRGIYRNMEVKVFCSRNEIDMPDLDCLYKIGSSCRQTTIDHHYHFDVFNAAIDFILMELNTRFNESSVELLSLSTALDPKNSFDSFNSDDICKLATKFYPGDFTDQEIVALEYELINYKLDVMQNLKVSTLVELCQQLTESRQSNVYVMLTRFFILF